MIGLRFNRFVVIAELPTRQLRKRVYQCRCDCGEERNVVGSNLRNGNSASCGCFKSDQIHDAKFLHGRCQIDPTYLCWSSMRSRCNDANGHKFSRYGGRGIKVCERWGSFNAFLADMGERPSRLHTLDRKDNNGNYELSNCRWATAKEQGRNRSTTRMVTAFGETKPLIVWIEQYNIDFTMVWKRLARGWTAERALTEPNQTTKRAA